MLLAAALSAGNVEFDRTAAEGAARIAVRRQAAELAAKGPGAGVLSGAMLADPGAYATRAAAEAKCRELFAEKTRQAFEAACREIRRRLELPEDFELAFTDADRANLAKTFPKVFEAERREAVAGQAKKILSEIRPSEADFESHPEDRLRAVMTELVAEGQSAPVFEENKIYISEKIVDPMIAGARAERRRQREYLMRARCEAAAPDRLAKELEAKLNENVAAGRAKGKDPWRAWGVFPSVVKEALPAAAERRTLDRLVSRVETLPFTVDAAAVEAEIAKNPAAHVKARESERKFSDVFAKDVLKRSLDAAVQEAPPAERRELSDFLKERLTADSVNKAVERLVRREVMPKWKAAREAVAAKQIGNLWPSLANGTWYPSSSLADETAARSDYAAAVRDWRKVAGLRDLASADGGKPVLEETRGRVDAHVAQAFDRARNAIAAQNAIVEREHPAVLNELRAAGGRPKLRAIVERLTAVAEMKWRDARAATLWPDGKTPANADAQHRELFPSVRRKIELLAKAVLEELSEPSPAEKKPEEKKPEEPPPEETPEASPEETPEEEFEFTVSVVRAGDRVEVKLLKGKTPVVERTLDAKMVPFGSAMKEVADRLGRDLLKLR